MGLRSIADMLDVIVEPRYDTNTILAAGATLLTYFQVPIGAGTTNFGAATIAKNKADTNMELAGQLPSGYNFIVLGFRIMFAWSVTIADLQLAINGCVFTFSIGSKDFLTVPARTIPGGNGPYSGGAITAAANSQVGSNGWPTLLNNYNVSRKPFTLAQGQNFRATLTWPSGGQAVTTTVAGQASAGLPVTVYLDGYLKRVVQ